MRILLSLAGTAMLAACSHPSAPPAHPAEPQAAASAHRVKTPWDAAFAAREKAKNVQDTVNQHAARQRQAIDEQTH
jgi:uncharacterized lipoprotein YajG